MKILIPVLPFNPNLFSPIAEIFCNAKSFILFECGDEIFSSYENRLYKDSDVNIGKYLKDRGVNNVICNRICKTCFDSLKAANISIWVDRDSISIRESCQRFTLGELPLCDGPSDFEMHTIEIDR